MRLRATRATIAPISAFRFVNTLMAAGVPTAHDGETAPAVVSAVVD